MENSSQSTAQSALAASHPQLAQPPLRAAIYLRISQDTEGQGLGVERQEEDCRKLCAARGWTVVEVYTDNDKSAYQRRKPRQEYGRMLDSIKADELDVVVAWHPDRLHRQLRELVPFIDLVIDHHVVVETVKAGIYDLSTPSGRMQAAIAGAVAEHESNHKSDRIKRKLEENRASGKHHGGSRPFGWNEDRTSIRGDEAQVVRYATDQTLAGIPMRAIARDLNERGWKTATGREWRAVTVRGMVLRPRNAGILTHVVEGVVSSPWTMAEVGEGQWEPIVSLEDFRQVQAMLLNRSRVTNPGKSGKVHLLSTIATCGLCGAKMVVGRGKPYRGVSKPIYRCSARSHISRDMGQLDSFVSKLVIARMEKADIRSLMAEAQRRTKATREATQKMQELEDRLKDAAEAFANGAITMAQLTTINASVRPALDKLRSESVAPDRVRVLGDLVSATDPSEVWNAMTQERRRAVVSLLMTVTVMPLGKRSPLFNPDGVRIEWRTD